MRADRLISILLLLQTHGRMTAYELASQLEVSERTIYRDIEALSAAGIPVYTERGPGGGCTLMDGYQTRLTGLTEIEAQTLFLSNSAAPFVDLGLSTPFEDAMRKLRAALPASSRESVERIHQRFHLDTSWWYHKDYTHSCLGIIQAALLQDYKLYLRYQQDDGVISEQMIEPYGLVAKADVWYLIGYHASYTKVFRVERIQFAEMVEEPFLRPETFDLSSYWADYCKKAETQHPAYVIPLRLAPDEVSSLHQKLHASGYTLIENAESSESSESSRSLEQKQRIVPFKPYQRKNHSTVKITPGARRQEKKRVSPGKNNADSSVPLQKKEILLLHSSSIRPAQQKRPSTSYKKKHFKKQNCPPSPTRTTLKKKTGSEICTVGLISPTTHACCA